MRRDSTGLKVEIAFGCLVALLVGVGWLGLSRMGQINASTSSLFNERWERYYAGRQAASYFGTINRFITGFFLEEHGGKEEASALAVQVDENDAKGTALLKQIEAQAVSKEERELLGRIRAAKAAANASTQRMMNLLVNQDQPGKANKLMADETLPLLNKVRDAWIAYSDYEGDQLSQAGVRSKASYAMVRRLSLTLVFLAIGLAICIAMFVTGRLDREMQERERAQMALRDLNRDLEKKVAERTEDLARTVETLREEVNERSEKEVDLRRLALIVESSGDAIIASTLEGVVTDWNPGAERMLGFARNEIIGKPLSVMTPEDRFHERVEIRSRLANGEEVVRMETVRRRKDGKLIHVSMALSPLKDPAGRIVGGSGILRDITERKFMEDAHRRSGESFRSFVENAPYGILKTTPEGRILQANPALVKMLGYASEQELMSLRMGADVYRDPVQREETILWMRNQDVVQGIEVDWKQKSGKTFTVRCSARAIKDGNGKVEYWESFVEDISERRTLELQLRQGQKMEAIGRLAGGIAHDFNNLLGVIIGYGDLLLEQSGANSPQHNPVVQIKKAADRASALTRQLLAFSRQQVLEMKVLNLNAVVAEMGIMLQRLLGEDIAMETWLDPELGQVKADEGQIEQVLMNLAVNARDAMPGGGRLLIETRNVFFEEGSVLTQPPMIPGEYVMLLVKDTGMGMDALTQAHIFEPFFTTKERGKGTGLGLATVYGFVKQSGGYVWVNSESGAGSTFTIYLPKVREKAEKLRAGTAMVAPSSGVGTILLVEDEESLRTLTRGILEQSGYKVLEASNGTEAIDVAKSYSAPIHLLLTDMVMPGMNGRAVAERVGQLYPEIKVAYMSGYSGFNTRETAALNGIIIAKPFTRNILLQKLSEALRFEAKLV